MASRLLTVTLETKYYQASIPNRRITYMQSSIELTEQEYNDIFSKIPNFWNSENDKLIRFVYFDDDTYFCERQKKAFNYTTRESEDKIYRFDYASPEEGKALFAFFVEYYGKVKIARTENLYDSIMNEIRDTSVVKISLLDARNKLLQDSDYLMMPDYPLSEEVKKKWATYRQELRDLTEQEAWISNDIINIKFPISPEPFEQLGVIHDTINDFSSIPPGITEEIINAISDKPVEDIIRNIAQTSIKFDILKSISKLKIPILDLDYTEIISDESSYEDYLKEIQNDALSSTSILPQSWWEAATSNLEEKTKTINQMLQKYNVDFTINDILNALIEDSKFTPEEIEVNTIINEL